MAVFHGVGDGAAAVGDGAAAAGEQRKALVSTCLECAAANWGPAQTHGRD